MARTRTPAPPPPTRAGAGWRRNLVGVVLAAVAVLAFVVYAVPPIQQHACTSWHYCGKTRTHPAPAPKGTHR